MKRLIRQWFEERTRGYYQDVIATALSFMVQGGGYIVDVAWRESDRFYRFLNPIRVDHYTWLEKSGLGHDVQTHPSPQGIIGIDLVNYAQDIQGALDSIARLAETDTSIILTRLNPLWTPCLRIASWIGLARPRQYANWITRQQFEHFLHLSDLDIIRYDQNILLPIRIPVLSWFVNTYLARLPILRQLCLVEIALCRVKAKRNPIAPSVSVVIPARNEKGNIENALNRMPRFDGALEVIFVEGHSSDGTWDTIQEVIKTKGAAYPFRIKAIQQTGKGKGDAVRKGFDIAKHDILMILDADLTVPPEDLPRFYRVLADRRAEYVQGTRLVYPMQEQAMRPLNWLGNTFFSHVLSYLLGQHVTDTLCGTKCLYRDMYARISSGRAYFGDFDPFGDFDLLFGVSRLGARIEEIPIRYQSRLYGETQIRRFRDGLLLLRMCLFASRKLRFLPHTNSNGV